MAGPETLPHETSANVAASSESLAATWWRIVENGR
jgi:hypothetical protein